MDQLIFASLSHTHYWYEVGMLKVPAVFNSDNYLGLGLIRIETGTEKTTIVDIFDMLKKNQSAPRPSEHPPVMGGKMSKRLGGIKGCKHKTCRFSHLAYWLPTRKMYFTRWPIPLVVC